MKGYSPCMWPVQMASNFIYLFYSIDMMNLILKTPETLLMKKDKKGRNALFAAALYNQLESIKFLRSKGMYAEPDY